MSCSTRSVALRNAIISTLCLMALGFWSMAAQAQQSHSQLRPWVVQAVDESSKPLGVFVDPLVINTLVNDVSLYYSNFCDASGAGCKITRQNRTVLVSAVREFLTEYLRTQPVEIKRLAARIAGQDQMARIGQTESMRVSFTVIDLGQRATTTAILIKRLPQPVEFEGTGNLLLTVAGTLEIGERKAGSVSWRTVSLTPNQRVNLGTVAPSSLGDVSMGALVQPLDAFCTDGPAVKYLGPHAMFNWGRATIDEDEGKRRDMLVPFARASAVDLTIDVDPSIKCDAECRRDVSAVFAQAFAAWKGGCIRCDPNAFAFIRAGGNLWIAEHLAARLRARANGNTSIPLDLSKGLSSNELPTLSVGTGTSSVFAVNYLNITLEQKLKQQVCSLASRAAPWVVPAQSLVCEIPNLPLVASDVVRASLAFLNRETSCGPGTVACGLPSARVEINGATYGFIIPRSTAGGGEYSLGRGELKLGFRPVVMHEVGHWFGVPHADVAGVNANLDIMATPYGTGPTCISQQSAIMVNNAADKRWAYRLQNGGGALHPPPVVVPGRARSR
jgi:hypothetical protein